MTPTDPNTGEAPGGPFRTSDSWLALLSIIVVIVAFGATLVLGPAAAGCPTPSNTAGMATHG